VSDRIVHDPSYLPTELRSQYGKIAPGERIHHGREGYQRLVVGFRDDDPRRWSLGGDIRGGVPIGRCVDCHHEVYGDQGARRAVIDRDAAVGCSWCNEQFREIEKIHQSGMVVQL
jgi:hypothetical protein